jgi:hypothetical protein
MSCGYAGVLTNMHNFRVILLTITILIGQSNPILAKTQKVGNWRLNLNNNSCIMEYDGWGKNLSIVYLYMPGLMVSADISFSGIRVKRDSLSGGGSMLEVYSPYSRNRGSFYHHNDGGASGWGLVSYVDDDGNYDDATLYTILDFLNVIGGGGVFTFTEKVGRKEVVSFQINGNKEASKLMSKCLMQFI